MQLQIFIANLKVGVEIQNGCFLNESTITITVNSPKSIYASFSDRLTTNGLIPFRWLSNINPEWTNDFESASTNDFDNDGFSTKQEYWSGTDPIDNNSFLKINDIAINNNSLRSVSGKAHRS